MIKVINKILSSHLFYILVFLVISSQVIFWFHGENIINVSDFSLMLSPYSDTLKLWFRWDHTRGLGVSQDRNSASLIYSGFLALFYGLNRSISFAEKALFFSWFFLSCISIYILLTHLLKRLSKNSVSVPYLRLAVFAGSLFYVLNPFLYNYRWGNGFLIAMFIYSVGPLLVFCLIKMFEAEHPREKLKYFLYFSLVNIWAIPAFENPAYFLSFYSILFPLFIIYRKDLKKNKWTYLKFFLLYLLANAWWILRPLSFFSSSQFMSEKSGVDNLNLINYEFRNTSFLEVFRLQGYWATQEPDYFLWGKYYFTNRLIVFNSYLIVLLSFAFALFKKGQNIIKYSVWIGFFLILLFLIKGMHEPASFIFNYLINNTPFRMFRFSMEKFYPILILIYSFFISLSLIELYKYKKKFGKIVVVFALFAILLNAYPFIVNGVIAEEDSLPNKYLKKYYSIPDGYYRETEKINKKKLNNKYLVLPENANSPSNSWTVYKWSSVGVDPLWNLLKSSPYLIFNQLGNSNSLNPVMSPMLSATYNIYEKDFDNFMSQIEKPLGLYNAGSIIFRKDNFNEEVYKNPIKRSQIFEALTQNTKLDLVSSSGDFLLFKLDNQYFLPLFYTQDKISLSKGGDPQSVIQDFSPDTVIYQENQFRERWSSEFLKGIQDKPEIEYKRINPTKYRLVIHNAQNSFPLVFSETFHSGWKAYLSNSKQSKVKPEIVSQTISNYKILDGNAEDQATKEELTSYISQGLVTTLGDGKTKEIKHNKWENDKEKLDYVEKYTIDFVSKDFKGTIQNDNLDNGSITETWFKTPIENNDNHLIANGYANSWIIDTESICASSSSCTKNPDGSYDFEMVLEFWPQRVFYAGLAISLITLFFWLCHTILFEYKK